MQGSLSTVPCEGPISVVAGLRLIKRWLEQHPNEVLLEPRTVAGGLEKPGTADQVLSALEYWRGRGLAMLDLESRKAYVLLPRLYAYLEERGCLRGSCASCPLRGTVECPFLEGVSMG